MSGAGDTESVLSDASSSVSGPRKGVVASDVEKGGGKRRERWTLNKAINAIGPGKFQLGIGLLCGLSQLADGIQQLSVGFLLHYLGGLFHLSNQGKALVGTVSGAGMLIGAFGWGRVSDVMGRRFAFAGTLLMMGAFGLMAAAAPSYQWFLVFRFLLTIGVGGNVPLGFTIFTEMSPKENRGGYLTMLEAFWSLGAIIACVLAWLVLPLPTLGWRWFIIFSSLPGIILGIVAFHYMPESPRFLVVHGQLDRAQLILDRIAKDNGRPAYKYLKLSKSEESFENSKTSDLFTPQYRRKTIVLFLLYLTLSFGCGVFTWLPVLLQGKKLAVMSMYRSMCIMATSQVPGVIAAAYMVERVGRKAAIGTFFFLGALAASVFAASTGENVIVTATIFMEFFLAGSNGALSAFTVELFPTTLRSSAMGACSAIARLSAVLNPTVWAALISVNEELAIMVGAGVLIFGAACVLLLPKTNPHTDIEDTIRKKKQDL